MSDNTSNQASGQGSEEKEAETIGSEAAKEEGLAYQMVSGAVHLEESGTGDDVTPSRKEKADGGREPEYYYSEHTGHNPRSSSGAEPMDRNQAKSGGGEKE